LPNAVPTPLSWCGRKAPELAKAVAHVAVRIKLTSIVSDCFA